MFFFAKLKALVQGRSAKWPEVEKAWLKAHPTCAACGSKKSLNVHHKKPFHNNPDLELVGSNLITLCRPHHFFLGHLDDWKSWNVDVERDAATILEKIRKRPV